jgi:hypothetical protein
MRIQSDDSCTAFIGSDSPELRELKELKIERIDELRMLI